MAEASFGSLDTRAITNFGATLAVGAAGSAGTTLALAAWVGVTAVAVAFLVGVGARLTQDGWLAPASPLAPAVTRGAGQPTLSAALVAVEALAIPEGVPSEISPSPMSMAEAVTRVDAPVREPAETADGEQSVAEPVAAAPTQQEPAAPTIAQAVPTVSSVRSGQTVSVRAAAPAPPRPTAPVAAAKSEAPASSRPAAAVSSGGKAEFVPPTPRPSQSTKPSFVPPR
jgi:hypothetical protein